MKKTTLGLASIALAASFSLSACGADEGQLAKEFCDLLEQQQDAIESGDPEELEQFQEDFDAWYEDNKDKRGSEEEFTDAVKEECPDFADLMP